METPGEMAAVLRRSAARVLPELAEINREVLERALEIAREKIGTGDDRWPEFAEATEEDSRWMGPLERTGEMRESLFVEHRGLVGMLASWSKYIQYSELGTSHEPPRPLLKQSIQEALRELGYARLRWAITRVLNP